MGCFAETGTQALSLAPSHTPYLRSGWVGLEVALQFPLPRSHSSLVLSPAYQVGKMG